MSIKTKPPVSLEDVRPLCKKLHLTRMMERLEEQFADPSIQELTPLEIIHDSLTSEVDRREENALKRRLREAHIPLCQNIFPGANNTRRDKWGILQSYETA